MIKSTVLFIFQKDYSEKYFIIFPRSGQPDFPKSEKRLSQTQLSTLQFVFPEAVSYILQSTCRNALLKPVRIL